MLEKNYQLTRYFDFYQVLLTEKQRDYFTMYYIKDYTLQEIATFYSVSRNAIYDQLVITQEKLLEYEQKLKLFAKFQQTEDIIKTYLKTKDDSLLMGLLEMDEHDV